LELDLLAIVGPTASGKTRRGVECARHFSGEIISGDSRQIYRGMDIGTGKDLDEYAGIRHHLIDVRPAGYKYNLHEFIKDFHCAYTDIKQRGNLPILCGGTGLYVESVLCGIRLPDVPVNIALRKTLESKSLGELHTMLSGMKKLHNITDVDTPKRAIRAIEICEYYRLHPEIARNAERENATKIAALIIGMEIDREARRERITKRLDQRLKEGMIDEVQSLLDSGIDSEDLKYYGLEYKFVTEYILHEKSYQEMRDGLEIAIHQFAKRQMTWFRGMERRGFNIHWLPYNLSTTDFIANVEKLIGNFSGVYTNCH